MNVEFLYLTLCVRKKMNLQRPGVLGLRLGWRRRCILMLLCLFRAILGGVLCLYKTKVF